MFPSYSKWLVCIHDAVAVGKSHCTQQVGVSSGKQQCWQIAVTWLASSNDATAATNDVEKSFMTVRYEYQRFSLQVMTTGQERSVLKPFGHLVPWELVWMMATANSPQSRSEEDYRRGFPAFRSTHSPIIRVKPVECGVIGRPKAKKCGCRTIESSHREKQTWTFNRVLAIQTKILIESINFGEDKHTLTTYTCSINM